MICSLFDHTRQGYYKRLKREAKRLELEDTVLKKVKEIRCRQTRVGTRKLQKMLVMPHYGGLKIGRDYLFCLLRRQGMLIKAKKKYKPAKEYAKKQSPNRLENLPVTRINQVWVTDITYLKVSGKDVYLFLITDLYSRKILSHYVSVRQDAESALIALELALPYASVNQLLIHHSDHGSQYDSLMYLAMLNKYGILSSMTGNLRCYDNAVAERVNETMKYEFGLKSDLVNIQIARQVAADAVDIYNHERLHLSLDYQTPASFYKAMKSAEATQLQSD